MARDAKRSKRKSSSAGARTATARRAAPKAKSTRKRATARSPKGGIFAYLKPGRANFAPLTPISFLARTAEAFPDRIACVHGDQRITYAALHERSRRLASALRGLGIRPGDTVSAMLPNVPAMLDVHFGVPMSGAVLNTINTRLDARTVAYILEHGEAKVLIADREYAAVIGPALQRLKKKPIVIDNDDPLYGGPGERLGSMDYEALLDTGDPGFTWTPPADESAAISLNYTSGTTGNPKGVVCHHRGTFIETVGNVLAWQIPKRPVFLWTLPMFHCNGWCYPWSITAMGGTHVCLRRVDPGLIFRLIAEEKVTHMCGAPTVLGMLINAPAELRVPFLQTVEIQTGGASPPAKVIRAMSALGFRVMHIYGMTELQGPSTLCEQQEAWSTLDDEQAAGMNARQGVRYPIIEGHMVADRKTLKPVAADGKTVGEVMVRGNTVMLGYLKDKKATAEAFAGGWMHTGDAAVQHPDGYIEIKDRYKDIIISGGENISSIEVELALMKHPAVALAAVVARPDGKWGETPCAFVQLKPDANVSEADIIAHCRDNLSRYMVPRTVVFGALPVTATGKIQKFTLREQARGM
jgi:fatty-acyl-CoA synthase